MEDRGGTPNVGASYANENERLIVSEPLPYTSKGLHPYRNGSRDTSSASRPRASSLPWAQDTNDLPQLTGAGGYDGHSSHGVPPVGPLNSAPPASLTFIPSSKSPRYRVRGGGGTAGGEAEKEDDDHDSAFQPHTPPTANSGRLAGRHLGTEETAATERGSSSSHYQQQQQNQTARDLHRTGGYVGGDVSPFALERTSNPILPPAAAASRTVRRGDGAPPLRKKSDASDVGSNAVAPYSLRRGSVGAAQRQRPNGAPRTSLKTMKPRGSTGAIQNGRTGNASPSRTDRDGEAAVAISAASGGTQDANDALFSSTQLLSSFKSVLNGTGTPGSGSASKEANMPAVRRGMPSPPSSSVSLSTVPASSSGAGPPRSAEGRGHHGQDDRISGAATGAAAPPYHFAVVLSSGKTSKEPISLVSGSGCVQGLRPTMEDAHFAKLNATHVRGQPVSLVAILDGHCGRRVADMGAEWLPHYFFRHAALGDNNALALVEAILQTDREIFYKLQAAQRSAAARANARRSNERNLFEEMFEESHSANGGSTLILAAVHGRMLYVACLGDARAVLYDGDSTVAMSEDHKPGNPDEGRRITKCGGFVQFGRVCGILAVSRALGDFEFKFQGATDGDVDSSACFMPWGEAEIPPDPPSASGGSTSATPKSNAHQGSGGSANPSGRRFVSNRELMVSNVADVRQLHLTDSSYFLLMACDGLWDVLRNDEATEFVRDFLSYTPDVADPRILAGERARPTPSAIARILDNCCQKLAEFAVDRGSTDNVSVVVIFFHDVVEAVAHFTKRGSASSGLEQAPRHRSTGNAHIAAPATGAAGMTKKKKGSATFELTNNQLQIRNGRVVQRR